MDMRFIRHNPRAGMRKHLPSVSRNHFNDRVGENVENVSGVLQPGVPKTEDSRDRVVPIPAPIMKQLTNYVAAAGLEPGDYSFAGANEFFSRANFYNRQ